MGPGPARSSAPGGSRTPNLMGRNHLLYPVELQGRGTKLPERVRATIGMCHTRGSLVAVAQLVRAPGCDPGGRGFEPRRSPSVPRGTEIPTVPSGGYRYI